MNKVTAKVLWWDARDGYGIAVDSVGHEYYIDSSVTGALPGGAPLRNQLIKGNINMRIRDCLCLTNVTDFLGVK